MKISKTSRILSIYHLFRYCEEVSYKEITDLMPFNPKTISRDICLLKRTGLLHVKYSKKRRAFVASEEAGKPDFPKNETQRLYLEKIIRLCTLMCELDCADDPVDWYREHYPTLSDRTRQRDFAELNKIGYWITYQRWDDGDEEHPVGTTYCDFPCNTYSLETFNGRDF